MFRLRSTATRLKLLVYKHPKIVVAASRVSIAIVYYYYHSRPSTTLNQPSFTYTSSPKTSTASTIPTKNDIARHADPSAQLLTLPSGRTISFMVYGDPAGKPVFYAHGWPGSKLEGACWHEHAAREGVRLVCQDRPGIGDLGYQAGRRLLGYVEDVEALSRRLGVDEYYILGMSGGGPVSSCFSCYYISLSV